MKNQNPHNVIHRRNRTIYRRETANLYTSRNAGRIFVRDCLCITRSQRHDLAFTRADIREEGKFPRTVVITRRRHYGVRADSLFTVKKNRIGQTGANPFARGATHFSRYFGTSICAWRWGSFRSAQSPEMGSYQSRQVVSASRIHGTSKETNAIWKGNPRVIATQQISLAEQGCSVRKGGCVTDDASALHEIDAVQTAGRESRTIRHRESTSTDARY